MAGAMRKMGIYLGLVEDDQYADEYEHPRPSARQRDRELAGAHDREVDEYHDDVDPEHDEPVAITRERLDESTAVTSAIPAPAPSFAATDPARRRFEAAPSQDWSTEELAEAADSPREESSYRITTLHPRTYNEARAIGEQFRGGTPVIMNLTEMDDADAKRLVDFAAGLTFALRGSIERVTTKVFLLSPQKVKVTAEQKAEIISSGGLLRHG